jgi:hypothetical protein
LLERKRVLAGLAEWTGALRYGRQPLSCGSGWVIRTPATEKKAFCGGRACTMDPECNGPFVTGGNSFAAWRRGGTAPCQPFRAAVIRAARDGQKRLPGLPGPAPPPRLLCPRGCPGIPDAGPARRRTRQCIAPRRRFRGGSTSLSDRPGRQRPACPAGSQPPYFESFYAMPGVLCDRSPCRRLLRIARRLSGLGIRPAALRSGCGCRPARSTPTRRTPPCRSI